MPGIAPPRGDAPRHRLAEDVEGVRAAWGLVYRSYLRAGLIDPHPARIHTVPQAFHPDTIVVLGHERGELATTISCYLDQPAGLPLDAVYPAELAELRAEGRYLSEVGLFADRHKGRRRSLPGLLEMMRLLVHYGLHSGVSDCMIGVHPRHTSFYRRVLGFETLGERRTCGRVNHHPVVLMRLDLLSMFDAAAHCRGVAYWRQHPVPKEVYRNRLRLDDAMIEGWRFDEERSSQAA